MKYALFSNMHFIEIIIKIRFLGRDYKAFGCYY